MIGGVVGYTYGDDNLCPSCTKGRMRANGMRVGNGSDHEDAIRRAAGRVGVDFSDEHSYDSGDFPKVITEQMASTELTELPDGERGMIPDERCDVCGKWMVLGEKSPSEGALTRYVRDAYELPHALAKKIAAELRRWGLSHPEFIKEDDARQAAAMFPHDFATVAFQGEPKQVVMFPTPQFDGDTCFHCDKPWEAHEFTCTTCGIEIPALTPHRHELPIKGRRRRREVVAP
ncbi:hypothetical protein [Streptomyces sp. NPDC088360]|uniref:hypothetical protein n=1 Tax=Streptomyces sp. NPDC088360 TaxID=3154515 RepID=UPI00344CE7E5